MADFIKFKLALAKTRRPARDALYDMLGDVGKPEVVGLIADANDYQLGTPNLERSENITLVASNSSTKDALVLDLKWRPDASSRTVTQLSRLTLIVADESVYEYEHVETYKPVESRVRTNRFMQFGSPGSDLKLTIDSPYRRMRILFHGTMTLKSAPPQHAATPPHQVFAKINAVICPVSSSFDFYTRFNADCFRHFYHQSKPQRGYEATIRDLLYHDRHEHMVRIRGEFCIDTRQADADKSKKILFLWGFHSRHFVHPAADEQQQQLRSERVLAFCNNGHGFHIGRNSIDTDSIGFGYVCFKLNSVSEAIDRPYEIDWSAIGPDTSEFKAQVSGQDFTFTYEAKRRNQATQFYTITSGKKKGWALVLLDSNGIDSALELDTIKTSRAEYNAALEAGLVSRAVSFAQLAESAQPLVADIDEPQCMCSDLVGAKASSLAELSAFRAKYASTGSYLVPHAFVLTRFAHDALMAANSELVDAIGKLQELVGSGDLAQLRTECDNIQKLVRNTQLPESVRGELSGKLVKHYGQDKLDDGQVRFAVRSSSWGEDEEDMSAAGQLKTLLNVKQLDQICEAVLECFASKFSVENIEYKRQHGLPLDLPMAVVVQEMVACEKAGVLFTCDPTSGDTAFVTITANYGLGESVVSGAADPDSVRVRVHPDTSLTIDSVHIGQKKLVISGNDEQQQHDTSKCCLSDDEILELARCGRALAAYFRCARDIEWGFAAGQLHLFQARPVTGLDVYSEEELLHEIDAPSRAEVDFFTRANIGEVAPYAYKPFTMTHSIFLWTSIGIRMNHRLIGEDKQVPRIATAVNYDSYHCFFALRGNPFLPVGNNPMTKTVMGRAMQIGFFGRELDERQPDIDDACEDIGELAQLFSGWRYEYYAFPLKHFTASSVLKERPPLVRLRAQIRSGKLVSTLQRAHGSKLRALYEQMLEIPRGYYKAWENHILLVGLANEANVSLMTVLAKYIDDPLRLYSALNRFLAAAPNVLSAEIPHRIKRMADLVWREPGDRAQRILAMSAPEAVSHIEADSGELGRQFAEFIERFGHRCYNEFEPAELSWRENKAYIVDMLRTNLRALVAASEAASAGTGGDTSATTAATSDERKASPEEIVDALQLKDLSAADRQNIVRRLAPRCQQILAGRELTKDIIVYYSDIEREVTRTLARELRAQLRIPDEDLFYYVLFDELEPLVRSPQPSIVVQALRRRNMFRRRFAELWKFEEIIRGSELVPMHLKPARELDAQLAAAPKLRGTPASSGRIEGVVCRVEGYTQLDKVRPGSILLTHSTDIAFSPVFPLISGLITEVGGLISHGAVVAREYGLPCVLGIPDVMSILRDGERIVLDADNGAILRLDLADASEPALANGASGEPATPTTN